MLSDDTLDRLGVIVVAANNASFLWRKLATDNDVITLSEATDPDELLARLAEVLVQEHPDERMVTLAYALVVALLITNVSFRDPIVAMNRATELYWLDRLLSEGMRDRNLTIYHSLRQPPSLVVVTPTGVPQPRTTTRRGT